MDQNEFNQLAEELKEHIAEGDVQAMRWLGDLYAQGLSGNDENYIAAFPYWKMAADNGDDEIAFKVGLCLQTGTGCDQNVAEAFPYLLRSADLGNAEAQYRVGFGYLDGMGTAADPDKGFQYLRRASLQNHKDAQALLGSELAKIGSDECYHWICCAYVNGHEGSEQAIREVMNNSPESVAWFNDEIEYIKTHGPTPRAEGATRSSGDYQSSSDGGGCYIATAVYGSYDAPEVMVLRGFRDNTLRPHWWGRLFIKVYYFLSPPIAEKLKDAKRINSIVRNILNHFVETLNK